MWRVSDEELTDLLADRLAEPRRSEVLEAIARDRKLAVRFESYRQQDLSLRALHDAILDEPVPEKLWEALRMPMPGETRAPLKPHVRRD